MVEDIKASSLLTSLDILIAKHEITSDDLILFKKELKEYLETETTTQVLWNIKNQIIKGDSLLDFQSLSEQNQREFSDIIEMTSSGQNFLQQLSMGDLAGSYPYKGYTAGLLKSLQSNLRHLSWQASEIADGVLIQKIDFMGDFSGSFNQMVESINVARKQLLKQEEELRRAYDIVKENYYKFRTILEETPDPIIWVQNTDGKIIGKNKLFEKTFGEIQDIDTSSISWPEKICAHQKDADLLKKVILNGDMLCGYEILLVSKTQSMFYGSVVTSSILLNDTSTSLFIIHDIDGIKRTKESLYQVLKKLNLLNRITKHDILNKVTAILLLVEFIRDQVHDPQIKISAENVIRSGKDIENLIEFTGQYQELGIYEPIWQKLCDVVASDAIQNMVKGIDLSLPEECIEIFADHMFEKVIYNLVENSIRHGKIVTHIDFSFSILGENLVLVYSDNGIGIANDEKPEIFNQGYGKNTGLGLFFIKDILSITNISIRECGMYGKGVRFEICIPQGAYRQNGYKRS
jgi:PAS domain S-box-containing protein